MTYISETSSGEDTRTVNSLGATSDTLLDRVEFAQIGNGLYLTSYYRDVLIQQVQQLGFQFDEGKLVDTTGKLRQYGWHIGFLYPMEHTTLGRLSGGLRTRIRNRIKKIA